MKKKLTTLLCYFLFSLKITAQNDDYLVNHDFVNIPKEENATLRFQFGSCAVHFFNTKKFDVFKVMARQNADFMIWLGDFLYFLKKKDWSSKEGMMAKYREQRSIPQLKQFLLKRPQYAIWDDHEYGWNNADRSFPLKDTSLAVFKHFWRNPSYGTPDLKGVFFNVRHADAEFFMTDGRYHCDKSPLPDGKGSTAMFGKEQMDWLKTALKNSTARFKFIVCGSQIISNDPTAENMGDYPVEKKDLLDFLQHENIKGVIFLSGDRHFAELSKMEREGTYPLYDITASSFTSPSYPHKLRNDYRVAGTVTKKHNFCRITLAGIGNDRVCYVELFDTKGNLIWKKEIKAADLQ